MLIWSAASFLVLKSPCLYIDITRALVSRFFLCLISFPFFSSLERSIRFHRRLKSSLVKTSTSNSLRPKKKLALDIHFSVSLG